MKLWEIKASALKLMFVTNDNLLNEDSFTIGEETYIYNDTNVSHYLVRMNDSIARAIDRYREYCGYVVHTIDKTFEEYLIIKQDEDSTKIGSIVSNVTYDSTKHTKKYFNYFHLFSNENIRNINSINIKYYNSVDTNEEIISINNVDFEMLVDTSKTKTVNETTYSSTYKVVIKEALKDKGNATIELLYESSKTNIELDAVDLSTDLGDYGVPEEVQRMIPYFVKGELYEEDEYGLSQNAMAIYTNFLYSFQKVRAKKQTQIKSSNVFKDRW